MNLDKWDYLIFRYDKIPVGENTLDKLLNMWYTRCIRTEYHQKTYTYILDRCSEILFHLVKEGYAPTTIGERLWEKYFWNINHMECTHTEALVLAHVQLFGSIGVNYGEICDISEVEEAIVEIETEYKKRLERGY